MSEKEKAEKIKKLEEIKMESESRNKDKLLIERANRIYSEISSSEIRSYISGYLEQYEMILKTDNKIRIKKAKKEMEIEEDDDDLGFLN